MANPTTPYYRNRLGLDPESDSQKLSSQGHTSKAKEKYLKNVSEQEALDDSQSDKNFFTSRRRGRNRVDEPDSHKQLDRQIQHGAYEDKLNKFKGFQCSYTIP